ncbi:MAG: polysaccharide deacetylase family protein [Melioribacteraceae bacterium]|nr:MAG: polysaccharide deacetylase family protein [Melioribacteraceae bacterium]
MKRFGLVILFLATISLAQEKFMAVTFDDLPFQQSGQYSSEKQFEFNKQIIKHILEYNIPAVGFVNEGKLVKENVIDETGVEILKLWLDSGLELGNHTYSHPNINAIPFEEYKADVLKGEEFTRKLAEERNIKYEYFRHPYLRSGETEEIMLSLKKFLKDNNYKEAPVTIDNSEWIFAFGYNKAFKENDIEMMQRLGADYVDYMIEKIKYYEEQSQKLFGRNIKQVLLVHANLLNADYFDELAEAIKNEGYHFVSLDEALQDEAYSSENNFVGKYGPSWIHRWALTLGVDETFFNGNPRVPQYLKDYSDIQYE